MKAIALRSGPSGGSPGVRLALALAVSLALHGALLLPVDRWWRAPPPAPAPPRLPPALQASWSAAALATHPEEIATTGATAVATTQAAPANAVPPVPTLRRETAKPGPLKGRALATALAALTREEFYPREAIARGLEGRVVLLLALSADGTVTTVEIASTSGHAILDQAAVHAAGRIGMLPGGQRQALLPVEFSLE